MNWYRLESGGPYASAGAIYEDPRARRFAEAQYDTADLHMDTYPCGHVSFTTRQGPVDAKYLEGGKPGDLIWVQSGLFETLISPRLESLLAKAGLSGYELRPATYRHRGKVEFPFKELVPMGGCQLDMGHWGWSEPCPVCGQISYKKNEDGIYFQREPDADFALDPNHPNIRIISERVLDLFREHKIYSCAIYEASVAPAASLDGYMDHFWPHWTTDIVRLMRQGYGLKDAMYAFYYRLFRAEPEPYEIEKYHREVTLYLSYRNQDPRSRLNASELLERIKNEKVP